MDEKFKRKIMEDVGLGEKKPISWTHPLFLAILILSLLALGLVIWVSPVRAQSDTTWQDPYGWSVVKTGSSALIMDYYYDIKNQYGYGESEIIWCSIMDRGIWKQWSYIDMHEPDSYWGFWIDAPQNLHLLSRFQIEVEVEVESGYATYLSSQYIISLGNGGVAYIVDFGTNRTHTIINDTYDGNKYGHTLIMARFPWGTPPKRVVRYRFRGFMY